MLLLFALLALIAAKDLAVTPEGGWLTASTFVKFTSDLKNPQFRYYQGWSVTVLPRPNNTTGTLWTGVPISVTTNTIICVVAYNSTHFDPYSFQTHTYVFFNQLTQNSEFHYKPDLTSALKQIPLVSITRPTKVPEQNNNAPEVAGVLEWIDAKGGDRLFYFGGVKYSGNYNVFLEKKSYRLYFSTKEWGGAGKFDEDIYQNFSTGLRPAHRFENVQFRSGSADSIVYLEWGGRGTGWAGSYGTLLRNPFGDELQLQAGHRAAHTRFVHLLDNGVYFGVYHVRERVDSNYLADYVGGINKDYEFNNHCVIRDGNGTLFNRLKETQNSYALFKEWADVPQLCDYMLMQQFNLNFDVNSCWNWQGYGPYSGSIDGGFQFYGSDIDFSLVDPAGGWIGGIWWDGPFGCWASLWKEKHIDFVQIFHDRLYALFYNDGVMTPPNLIRTMRYLQAMIDQAMIAETARWRYNSLNQRYTIERWNQGVDYIVNQWLDGTRQSAYFTALQGRGMFPPAMAPMFSPLQGRVDAGTTVTISNQWSGSTIYCTTDGTDPRAAGGSIVGTSHGSGPATVGITKSTTLSCRSRATDGRWTPLQQRNFIVKNPFMVSGKIQITELSYDTFDSNYAEWIEIKNLHTETIDLVGCTFQAERVKMTFTKTTPIKPGGFLVGTNQRMQFRLVYGKQADFFYSGDFKKSSALKILDAWNDTVVSIEWKTKTPWPVLVGLGYTLVPGIAFKPLITGSTKAKSGSDWRFSLKKKGSPWADDALPVTLTTFDEGNDYLLVNEVFLNPKSGARWVEFKNVGNTPLNIAGWGLTDNIDKLTKYVFKAGTVVPAGGFLVMDETQIGFKLNEDYLLLINPGKDYGINLPNKALQGYAQGRVTTSDGMTYFAHLVSPTKGASNAAPFIPDVVISGFGWGIPSTFVKYKYIKLTNTGKKIANMTGWVVSVTGEDFKFKRNGIHDVLLLPNQSVYLLQKNSSISDFKKLFASQWLDPTSVILNVLKADDFIGDIKLQQPDDGTEVTVDRIDTGNLAKPTGNKRQAPAGGPIEMKRNLPPTFSLDPLSWKTVTLPSPPPVNCQWGSYGEWSKCVNNIQTRTRTKVQVEMFGGVPCDDLQATQTQTCSNTVDCSWTAWSEWTQCSTTCGIGTMTRFRTENKPQNGGTPCSGLPQVQAPCKIVDCPVDCEWHEWSLWTPCDTGSSACGVGIRQRTRDYSAEQFGGLPCDDHEVDYDQCEIDCPVVSNPVAPPTDAVQAALWGDQLTLLAVFVVFMIILAIVLVVVIVLALKYRGGSQGNGGYQTY